MTKNIHKFLKKADFVRCPHPHHHQRRYTLKHHKNAALLQVYFNSFELLDEADKVLTAEGIKAVKTLPHQSKGCFLIIGLNQE